MTAADNADIKTHSFNVSVKAKSGDISADKQETLTVNVTHALTGLTLTIPASKAFSMARGGTYNLSVSLNPSIKVKYSDNSESELSTGSYKLTWALDNPPAGFSINETTGVLTAGNDAASGSNSVTVKATAVSNTSTNIKDEKTAALTITVTETEPEPETKTAPTIQTTSLSAAIRGQAYLKLDGLNALNEVISAGQTIGDWTPETTLDINLYVGDDMNRVSELCGYDSNNTIIEPSWDSGMGVAEFASVPSRVEYLYATNYGYLKMDVTLAQGSVESDGANGSGGGCDSVRSEELGGNHAGRIMSVFMFLMLISAFALLKFKR